MTAFERAEIVEQLAPHQQESGLVTRREIGLARRWRSAVCDPAAAAVREPGWIDEWLAAAMPFGFQYGGKEAAPLLARWRREEKAAEIDGEVERAEIAWLDPATGLRAIWQQRIFQNFPAVEWILHFENTGAADTPILENIRSLDLAIRRSRRDSPFTVHGAQGGRSHPDDYGAWSSFAGQFLMGWHPLNPDFPFEQARRQIERYKAIRAMLRGDFYPLTECSLTAPWLAFQFHLTGQDRGFALVFRRQSDDASAGNAFALQLRGLTPAARYRIRCERAGHEQVLPEEALTRGLALAFPEIPGVEMVRYERVAAQ
jgi:hypothetical protein